MFKFLVFCLVLMVSVSCSISKETTVSPDDWTDETHSKNVSPNYDLVFAGDTVHRIDVVISPDDWQDMQDDMTQNYGAFGAGGGPGGGGPGGGGPGMNFNDENPIFVPCSFNYQGKEWYKVGIRFKGNSSLLHTWKNGIGKLALKFDFDEFEDEFPEIKNQRFYGFKQLSMSNNFNDTSFLRERVVPEIFRESGVAAPYTAFCRVYIDHGDGPIYFGLYTMVEVVDDTMLEDQFGDESGNCYKPEGTAAAFSYGSFNEGDFVKKTNEDANDWSDVIGLFDALHSDLRSSAPEQWRAQLETVFDVEGFLRWLAVNTLIQNWDTYGRMTHNYYLYNNHEGNRLTWIPWDNNEALQQGKQGGALSLALNEVGDNWPLIRFLADDPVYYGQYVAFVNQIAQGAFHPDKMAARYRELQALVQPYVTGNDGELEGYSFLHFTEEFNEGVEYLVQHAGDRCDLADSFVQANK
ncbi:MAG: spore coat protein [bacterium]|nr:spore coat protein [bacterium]